MKLSLKQRLTLMGCPLQRPLRSSQPTLTTLMPPNPAPSATLPFSSSPTSQSGSYRRILTMLYKHLPLRLRLTSLGSELASALQTSDRLTGVSYALVQAARLAHSQARFIAIRATLGELFGGVYAPLTPSLGFTTMLTRLLKLFDGVEKTFLSPETLRPTFRTSLRRFGASANRARQIFNATRRSLSTPYQYLSGAAGVEHLLLSHVCLNSLIRSSQMVCSWPLALSHCRIAVSTAKRSESPNIEEKQPVTTRRQASGGASMARKMSASSGTPSPPAPGIASAQTCFSVLTRRQQSAVPIQWSRSCTTT